MRLMHYRAGCADLPTSIKFDRNVIEGIQIQFLKGGGGALIRNYIVK
jgi:hypothetical protein